LANGKNSTACKMLVKLTIGRETKLFFTYTCDARSTINKKESETNEKSFIRLRDTLRTCCQFHQRFTRTFFVQNFGAQKIARKAKHN